MHVFVRIFSAVFCYIYLVVPWIVSHCKSFKNRSLNSWTLQSTWIANIPQMCQCRFAMNVLIEKPGGGFTPKIGEDSEDSYFDEDFQGLVQPPTRNVQKLATFPITLRLLCSKQQLLKASLKARWQCEHHCSYRICDDCVTGSPWLPKSWEAVIDSLISMVSLCLMWSHVIAHVCFCCEKFSFLYNCRFLRLW